MQPKSCPVCGGVLPEAPITVHPERGIVVANGSFALLTGKEALLIEILAEAFPKHLSKTQIMERLYTSIEDEPEIKIVDVLVCKVRKKVKEIGVDISTIWGSGYALSVQSKPVICRLESAS